MKEKYKRQKNKQTNSETSKGRRSYSGRMRGKRFCCAFKLFSSYVKHL